MDLVERHTQLAELEAALQDARAGQGRVVLVTGEAGAGKTALLRRFRTEAAAPSKILWGMCDELLTPRPLGPFRDIAGQLDAVVSAGQSPVMLDSIVAALGSEPSPTVVVIEDAHWADEATLDAIRFLGRRIGRMQALLAVTYRDDEVPADHSLRSALGAIPPDDIRRIMLPPLSRGGVAQLAGREDVDELYRLTGGNPFYLTEVLAAHQIVVPHTVQDAVMARTARLSDGGRVCVETAAVVPGRAERWILAACQVAGGIDEAARLGIFHAEGDVVCFSHELVRRAAERSLSPARRREINRGVMEVLADRDVEPARLAHHAVQAEVAEAVARYAPLAARRAASLDSHREAVDHFEQALTHPDQLDDDELADLLEDYAHECKLTARHDSAQDALLQAIAIRRKAGDLRRLGADLCQLADIRWFQGRGAEADEAVAEAVTTLESIPPERELAGAYAQRSKLAFLDFRLSAAATWGDKGVELARQLGESRVLAAALTSAGVARWLLTQDDSALLVEGLELARAQGLTDEASRAYVNLATVHTNLMQYVQARTYIEEGLAYCEEHDLIARAKYLVGTRAWWHLEQGHWPDAEQDAQSLLTVDDVSRVTGSWILGWLQTRRGDPDAERTLAEAHQLADRSGEMQHIVPVALIRAELAWLHGDPAAVAAAASPALDAAVTSGNRRWIGEAALWLHRVGALKEIPDGVPQPFSGQISGGWREAAAMWAELGLPYEQADALAEAPEPPPLFKALEILDQLGARPRAAMVRGRLVELGVTSVPRGPRDSTRANPAGLTSRQTEVLQLLADGLTYHEIAQRLHLSVKTVDHHAAAVRMKLDAATRAEAVAAGRRLGIVAKMASQSG